MDSPSPDSRARQFCRWINCSLCFPRHRGLDVVHDLPCQMGSQVVPPQVWLPRKWYTDPTDHGHHFNDRLHLRVYD